MKKVKCKTLTALVLALLVCMSSFSSVLFMQASASPAEHLTPVNMNGYTGYIYKEDFEGEVDFEQFSQYEVPAADGQGTEIYQETAAATAANETTGSTNPSSTAYVPAGNFDYTQEINYSMPTNGNQSLSGYGFTSSFGPSKAVWEQMEQAGSTLNAVSGQFKKKNGSFNNTALNINGPGIFFIYDYAGPYQFKAFSLYYWSEIQIKDLVVNSHDDMLRQPMYGQENFTDNSWINSEAGTYDWLDFSITYNSEGKAEFTLTYGDSSATFTATTATEPENRVFAVGCNRNPDDGEAYFDNQCLIDNIEMQFSPNEHLITVNRDGVKGFIYNEDFEGAVDFAQFSQYEIPTGDGGSAVYVEGSNGWGPKVLANENQSEANSSANVFAPNGDIDYSKIEGYTVNAPNYLTGYGFTSYYSASQKVWDTVTGAGTVLQSVSGQFKKANTRGLHFNNMGISPNGDGIFFIYEYQGPYQFKAFLIYGSAANDEGLTVNDVIINSKDDMPGRHTDWLGGGILPTGETGSWTSNKNDSTPGNESYSVFDWIDFEITYNAENKAQITLSYGDLETRTCTAQTATDPANRVIAIGNNRDCGYNGYGSETQTNLAMIDNIEMKFAANASDIAAVEFYAAHSAIIDCLANSSEWTDTEVTKEQAMAAFVADYEALPAEVLAQLQAGNAQLETIYNTAKTELSTGDIAEFRQNYAGLLAVTEEAAKQMETAELEEMEATYAEAEEQMNALGALLNTEAGKALVADMQAVKNALAYGRMYQQYKPEEGAASLDYTNDFETQNDFEQVNYYTESGKTEPTVETGLVLVENPRKDDGLNASAQALRIQPMFNWQIGTDTSFTQYNSYFAPNHAIRDAAMDSGMALSYASGQFNLNATKPYVPMFIVYAYKDANHFRAFHIYVPDTPYLADGYIRVDDVEIDLTNKTITDKTDSNFFTAIVGSTDCNFGDVDAWVNFEVYYNAEGKAVLTLSRGDKRDYVQSVDAVPDLEKFFAIGKVGGFNNDADPPQPYPEYLYVDNVRLSYTASAEVGAWADANAFNNKHRAILTRDTAYVAPYDVAAITAAQTEYNTLDTAVQEVLTQQGTSAKITALATAAQQWDVTDDQTVANSFKTVFAALDAQNVKAAYNVYNRLTAAQKALLASEYKTMLGLLGSEAQASDNKTNIALMGDSNTYGAGLNESGYDNSQRWGNVLGAQLGENFVLDNYGVSGIRVINDETNLTGIQFEEYEYADGNWERSHNKDYDMVIVALGTNDVNANLNSPERISQWQSVYEQLIQSYMALESSPVLILSTFESAILAEQGSDWTAINQAIRDTADKYGLLCADFAARSEESRDYFQGDALHWNPTGHQWLADTYYAVISAVTANMYSLSDMQVFYGYRAQDVSGMVNGFAPTLVSATIRKGTENQDVRFKATLGANILEGKTVAEYGMVIADYRYIKEGVLAIEDLTCDTISDKIVVARSSTADNTLLGQTYYVNVGGLTDATYGAPFIARAYVKYTDGTVYYSANTNETGDYDARTGVKNGCAVRSVISITKAMILALDSLGVDVSSVVTVADGVITGYVNEDGSTTAAPQDTSRLFAFVTENAGKLENQ